MQTEQLDRERQPLVELVERRLGGPIGQHARRVGLWFTAGPWVLLTALVSWLLLMWRQTPCRQADITVGLNAYHRMCYSDIAVLYQNRKLQSGASPYGMEYPVLTGWFIDVTRAVARGLGAPMGAHVDAQKTLDSANIFFAVNAFFLFVCFLLLLWAQLRTTPRRPWDALMVAGAPVLVATGLINWDLLCVSLTAVSVLCWARRRPTVAGALLGLAVAAKLYPILLLVPLFCLALRSNRWKELLRYAGAAVVAWGIPNLLSYLKSPADWKVFWMMNVHRKGDLGSIWYVLGLMGIKVGDVSVLQAILMILGALAVLTLALLAPRRPRFAQLAFLMIVWFLIVNKVYSPQYVLWLLPFVVLARPRWFDWLIWTVGELIYFAAIWGHLAGAMYAADSQQDRLYWAAVFIRIGVQVWLAIQVVMDVLHPDEDPLRVDAATDDPHGGIFDHAADAPWLAGFRRIVLGTSSLEAKAASTTPARRWHRLALPPAVAAAPDGATQAAETMWRIRQPGRTIIRVWAFSRLLLLGLALFSLLSARGRTLSDAIQNWDVKHFYDIAREGYVDVTDPAFFPGLPMLLRAFSLVGIPYDVTGIVLSGVCSFLAAWALWRLGGRTAGPWASVLWLIAPTAVFAFVPYTEALFCALAFWAWDRGRATHWSAMASLALLACTVRVSGLFLIGALAILILTRGHEGKALDGTSTDGEHSLTLAQRCAPLVWLALPAAGLVGYAWFGKLRFGTWMAWYHAQTSGWARSFHWPWQSFLNTIPVIVPGAYSDHPGWSWVFRGEVISMVVGIVCVVVLLRRRLWAEASWIAVQVLAFSLSYWWMSVNRAVLLWFPLWILLGEWVTRREPDPARRRFRAFIVGTAIGIGLIVMSLWAYYFYIGWWAS